MNSDLPGLHWIDLAIVAAYAVALMAVGWHYGRKQESTAEYFSGGGRMNPLLIGISLFATLFSTISFLAIPGEVLSHGPVVSLTGLAAIPIFYYIVGHLMAPAYMRYRAASAYAILEVELGLGARIAGAVMFILLRLMWMSTLIYFASKAMLVMLGLGAEWLPWVTLATGSIAIFYAALGGLRAVVMTDVIQFLLLFSGALLVVAAATYDTGGLGWLPTQWNESWDDQPLFDFDPTVRVTIIGSVFYSVFWWVCTAGGDQTAIQRFMATKDAAAARQAFLVNSLAGGAVAIVLMLVGFSLLGFYQADSSRVPGGGSIAMHADLLFPYFISHHLPTGLSGLVVCGMFAAAMSSVDSGVNSVTAVVTTDFIERFRDDCLGQRSQVRLARVLSVAIGVVVLITSSFVIEYVPGNFLEQAMRTFGLLVGPMFLLFLFALFVPFVTQAGAILGALIAFFASLVVAYWGMLFGPPGPSFQWTLPVSLAVGFAFGCVWSWVANRLAE